MIATYLLICGLLFYSARILSGVLGQENGHTIKDDDDDDDHLKGKGKKMNFASSGAGASVINHSPESAKGYSNLLTDDKDKYALSQCSEKKWVVILLSEECIVKSVVMANYERYSSTLKEFQLLASSTWPPEKNEWIDLGTYTAEPKLGEQSFSISENKYAGTVRYLKVKFNSHYSNEALCTYSQIKVHGDTAITSLRRAIEETRSFTDELEIELNKDKGIHMI